jgi:hypothetical protein
METVFLHKTSQMISSGNDDVHTRDQKNEMTFFSHLSSEQWSASYPRSYSWGHPCFKKHIISLRSPLWSSGQSSWLRIQRSRFGSRSYQILWEVVGLERGPLSLVSTIEELFGRESSGYDLESWEYGRRDPSRWPRGTLYPQKLALTSPTSGGRSVGIIRSRTEGTEFACLFVCL